MKKLIMLLGLGCMLFAQEYYYEYGKKIEVQEIKNTSNKSPSKDSQLRHFTTSQGFKVGVKDEILVVCVEINACSKTLENYSLKSVKALSSNIFLVQVENIEDVFNISNSLYEEQSIKSAHPNFIKQKVLR